MIDSDPYDFAGLEQQYGLPGGILSAVSQTESGGNPNAVSPKGAQGLFQFMPETAKQYGVDTSDPQSSAEGGAKYLADLMKLSGGDLDSTLASYNFGPGNVAAGKPLPQETQDYIAKVKGGMNKQYAQADTGNVNDALTSNPYQTPLVPQDEQAFQKWVVDNKVPFDDSPKSDYDMRGYWKAQKDGDPEAAQSLNNNDGRMHFPDTYKTPYHESFSNESKYATPDAPHWNNKDQLIDKGGNVVFDERAKASALPEGFTLDSAPSSTDLPEGFTLDKAAQKPSVIEDVAKSALYRGIPEGLMAATRLGYATNVVKGVSDLTRWAGGKAYKAIEGEDLPEYNGNPVPSSSDILQGASKGLLGKDLYEPQTKLGQYANTIASFATGGKATGIPLINSIPAAVASETAGEVTKGTGYETPARILGAMVGGRKFASNRGETLTADEVKAQASAAYQDAATKGGVLAPNFTNGVLNIMDNAKATPIAGKVLTSEGKALNDALGEYAPLKDTPLTLEDYQKLDKSLGDKEAAAMDGFKATPNSRAIGQVQDAVRARIASLSDADVQGGKAGIDALTKQAIPLYAKQSRLGDVERLVQKAAGTNTPDASIRTALNNLVNSPRFKQYTPAEQAALKRGSKIGVAGLSTKVLSSGLLPAVLAIGEDAATGGYTGAVTAYAVGKGINAVGKSAAKNIQLNRANNALNTISNSGVAKQPSPLLRLLQSDVPAPSRRIGLQKVGTP